jgi:hypothetical protein
MDIVIIIGLPRSGTTSLGRFLASSDKVHYLEEPNVIWRYKNFAKLGHDEFANTDATPEIQKYIQNRFLSSLEKSKKQILVEKTPSNSLRVPFVKSIFPDAKFIFILREEDKILSSCEKKWLFEDDNNKTLHHESYFGRDFLIKLRKFFQIPFYDYPTYLVDIGKAILFRLLKGRRRYWGPRYEGYDAHLDEPVRSQLQRMVASSSQVINNYRSINASKNDFIVDFEELFNSENEVKRLTDFLELEYESMDSSLILKK